MRFLADESCDFAVVKALRANGHDVSAIAEVAPGAEDGVVLARARSESRVVLTEDKDFGNLACVSGQDAAGVILIRYPANARSALARAAVDLVAELADRLIGSFVVLEPGRARLSRLPSAR